MVVKRQIVLRCLGSLGVGATVSTGDPIGIVTAIAMPPLAMHQPTRRAAYQSAFCYYAGALWPIVPAARNFFGSSASLPEGIAAWLGAALLLATPWPLAWTTRRVQLFWRVPLTLLTAAVPPLGLIGWASPLTAAGFLFPGTAWTGLLSFALLCGGLCTVIERSRSAAGFSTPRMSFVAFVFIAINAHVRYPGDPAPPSGWEGVNTSFGAIAHGSASPVFEYTTAEWIQQRARSSHARVIVFPETVVPRWTAATDLFWQQTLSALSENRKTILVGAGLPTPPDRLISSSTKLRDYDFSAAVTALRPGRFRYSHRVAALTSPDRPDSEAYQNAVVIRGAQQGTFIQRIPVPVGMWYPFSGDGVPLNLSAPGVFQIEGQRAAILICHEQLLTWPVLASMLENPTIVVAIANDCWVEGTSIPRYQANAVRAWARLFSLPIISAVNR
jgi:predicted amidohydrolase